MTRSPLLTLGEESLLMSLMISSNDGSFVPSEQPWEQIAEQMNQLTPVSVLYRTHHSPKGLKAYWRRNLEAKYRARRMATQVSDPARTASANLPPFRIV